MIEVKGLIRCHVVMLFKMTSTVQVKYVKQQAFIKWLTSNLFLIKR